MAQKLNKVMIIFTILLILFFIIGGSILKVIQKNTERKTLVATKAIIEGAESCYYDNVCKEEITLGELITLGYAKDTVNPKTNLYYSHDSKIIKKEDSFIFEGI